MVKLLLENAICNNDQNREVSMYIIFMQFCCNNFWHKLLLISNLHCSGLAMTTKLIVK